MFISVQSLILFSVYRSICSCTFRDLFHSPDTQMDRKRWTIVLEYAEHIRNSTLLYRWVETLMEFGIHVLYVWIQEIQYITTTKIYFWMLEWITYRLMYPNPGSMLNDIFMYYSWRTYVVWWWRYIVSWNNEVISLPLHDTAVENRNVVITMTS